MSLLLAFNFGSSTVGIFAAHFGQNWDDPKVIYGTDAGKRIKMDADKITNMFMLNPKDVRIAELETELAAAARIELEARE